MWDVKKMRNTLLQLGQRARWECLQTEQSTEGSAEEREEERDVEDEEKLWLAVKIICHDVHDTGIPTQVLISSLSHTSRRGSYFRRQAGCTVRTGRVIIPVIVLNHLTEIAAVSTITVLING